MRTRLFIIAYVVTLGSSALSAQVPTDKPSTFGSAMKKNLPPPIFGKTFDLASGTRVSVRTDDPAPWGTRLDDRGTSAKGSMIVVVLEFSEVAHILFEIRGEPHNSDVALEIDQVRINPLALATRMSGEYRFARLEAA